MLLFQIVPFGLANASMSFQGYIDNTLAKRLNAFVIMYPDDIFQRPKPGLY